MQEKLSDPIQIARAVQELTHHDREPLLFLRPNYAILSLENIDDADEMSTVPTTTTTPRGGAPLTAKNPPQTGMTAALPPQQIERVVQRLLDAQDKRHVDEEYDVLQDAVNAANRQLHVPSGRLLSTTALTKMMFGSRGAGPRRRTFIPPPSPSTEATICLSTTNSLRSLIPLTTRLLHGYLGSHALEPALVGSIVGDGLELLCSLSCFPVGFSVSVGPSSGTEQKGNSGSSSSGGGERIAPLGSTLCARVQFTSVPLVPVGANKPNVPTSNTPGSLGFWAAIPMLRKVACIPQSIVEEYCGSIVAEWMQPLASVALSTFNVQSIEDDSNFVQKQKPLSMAQQHAAEAERGKSKRTTKAAAVTISRTQLWAKLSSRLKRFLPSPGDMRQFIRVLVTIIVASELRFVHDTILRPLGPRDRTGLQALSILLEKGETLDACATLISELPTCVDARSVMRCWSQDTSMPVSEGPMVPHRSPPTRVVTSLQNELITFIVDWVQRILNDQLEDVKLQASCVERCKPLFLIATRSVLSPTAGQGEGSSSRPAGNESVVSSWNTAPVDLEEFGRRHVPLLQEAGPQQSTTPRGDVGQEQWRTLLWSKGAFSQSGMTTRRGVEFSRPCPNHLETGTPDSLDQHELLDLERNGICALERLCRDHGDTGPTSSPTLFSVANRSFLQCREFLRRRSVPIQTLAANIAADHAFLLSATSLPSIAYPAVELEAASAFLSLWMRSEGSMFVDLLTLATQVVLKMDQIFVPQSSGTTSGGSVGEIMDFHQGKNFFTTSSVVHDSFTAPMDRILRQQQNHDSREISATSMSAGVEQLIVTYRSLVRAFVEKHLPDRGPAPSSLRSRIQFLVLDPASFEGLSPTQEHEDSGLSYCFVSVRHSFGSVLYVIDRTWAMLSPTSVPQPSSSLLSSSTSRHSSLQRNVVLQHPITTGNHHHHPHDDAPPPMGAGAASMTPSTTDPCTKTSGVEGITMGEPNMKRFFAPGCQCAIDEDDATRRVEEEEEEPLHHGPPSPSSSRWALSKDPQPQYVPIILWTPSYSFRRAFTSQTARLYSSRLYGGIEGLFSFSPLSTWMARWNEARDSTTGGDRRDVNSKKRSTATTTHNSVKSTQPTTVVPSTFTEWPTRSTTTTMFVHIIPRFDLDKLQGRLKENNISDAMQRHARAAERSVAASVAPWIVSRDCGPRFVLCVPPTEFCQEFFHLIPDHDMVKYMQQRQQTEKLSDAVFLTLVCEGLQLPLNSYSVTTEEVKFTATGVRHLQALVDAERAVEEAKKRQNDEVVSTIPLNAVDPLQGGRSTPTTSGAPPNTLMVKKVVKEGEGTEGTTKTRLHASSTTTPTRTDQRTAMGLHPQQTKDGVGPCFSFFSATPKNTRTTGTTIAVEPQHHDGRRLNPSPRSLSSSRAPPPPQGQGGVDGNDDARTSGVTPPRFVTPTRTYPKPWLVGPREAETNESSPTATKERGEEEEEVERQRSPRNTARRDPKEDRRAQRQQQKKVQRRTAEEAHGLKKPVMIGHTSSTKPIRTPKREPPEQQHATKQFQQPQRPTTGSSPVVLAGGRSLHFTPNKSYVSSMVLRDEDTSFIADPSSLTQRSLERLIPSPEEVEAALKLIPPWKRGGPVASMVALNRTEKLRQAHTKHQQLQPGTANSDKKKNTISTTTTTIGVTKESGKEAKRVQRSEQRLNHVSVRPPTAAPKVPKGSEKVEQVRHTSIATPSAVPSFGQKEWVQLLGEKL